MPRLGYAYADKYFRGVQIDVRPFLWAVKNIALCRPKMIH